ncbi:MAG: hypothetical protein CMM07_26390 [Rhodopirellula sp.]|nr:hypothetical protein [Rhodopirellula sp.]
MDRDVHPVSKMNFFYLCPDDRDWLKSWLLKHAFLVVLILCFWLILNAWPKAETPISLVDGADAVHLNGATELLGASSTVGNQSEVVGWVEHDPQATNLVELPLNSVNAVDPDSLVAINAKKRPDSLNLNSAVRPTGWRRTRNGWENTANWRTSLGDIVRQQQDRESDWFQNFLARVRSVPPWVVALVQLTAVGGVLLFERRAARQQLQHASDA